MSIPKLIPPLTARLIGTGRSVCCVDCYVRSCLNYYASRLINCLLVPSLMWCMMCKSIGWISLYWFATECHVQDFQCRALSGQCGIHRARGSIWRGQDYRSDRHWWKQIQERVILWQRVCITIWLDWTLICCPRYLRFLYLFLMCCYCCARYDWIIFFSNVRQLYLHHYHHLVIITFSLALRVIGAGVQAAESASHWLEEVSKWFNFVCLSLVPQLMTFTSPESVFIVFRFIVT